MTAIICEKEMFPERHDVVQAVIGNATDLQFPAVRF